jgi:formylglycine-generating enzyme required for sulfatase activity
MKPANVLLEQGTERVKVADFGLAKTMDDIAITRTGEFAGTPQFMSPEQATGGLVDHRTDLFSLGAILYTMCTGNPPFRADNPLSILRRICDEAARPIAQINPDVPDWLSAIVDRLLAKSPTDRFQTAAEVAELLQKHLALHDAETSISRPLPDAKSRSATSLWRHWSIVSICLIAGFGVVVWFASNRTQPNTPVVEGTAVDLPRPADVGQKSGDKGLDSLTSGVPAKASQPGISSTEGNKPRDSFAGTHAGDRCVLTDLKMAFRWCPAGQFTMGSPKSEPGRTDNEDQVRVTLSQGFWLGETEVTQGEWQAVAGSTPWRGLSLVKEGRDFAAVYMTYEEALKFVELLTNHERNTGRLPGGWRYSLPTEAQWEYACRAGSSSAYCFGDRESDLSAYCWYKANASDMGESYAHLVGQKHANAWGLKDMHGNVWEWCLDDFVDRLPGGVDPIGMASGSNPARRGGGWGAGATVCRSANRGSLSPMTRYNTQGLRVAVIRSGQ